MKNHIKIQLLTLLLFFNLVAFSQTLTPAFSIKIAFEDKAKHKDTITIGYDPLANNAGVDTLFGEQDTWGTPWDSLFQVKVCGPIYPDNLGKTAIAKKTTDTMYCYDGVPSGYYFSSVASYNVYFRCKSKNFPVSITWDYTQFSGSSCHAYSAIVYNCATSEPSLFPVHRMNLPFGIFNLETPYYYSQIAGENGYIVTTPSNVLNSSGGIVTDTVYVFAIILSSKWDLFHSTLVTGIQDQTVSELSAKVYPNPARTEVVVSCPEPAWYRLYDLSGKQVYEQYHNAGDNIIDVSTVPKGLYLMRLQGKNKFWQQKLIVE